MLSREFTEVSDFCRWDCISINNNPVDEALFKKIENHYTELSLREGISASPFEILTATAFHIFNEEQVQIGVVEVGMGGKLDATNILNNQAVSVISKIAKDHQSFLGNTLGEIALHKAGILRPDVPYIINPRNEHNVHVTIDDYASEIGAGPRLDFNPPELKKTLFTKQNWLNFSDKLGQSQRDNATLAAIAAKTAVESMHHLEFRPFDIASIMWRSRLLANPGRLESIHVPPIFGGPYRLGYDNRGPMILVDGAHNPDAAKVLHDHIQNDQRRKKIYSDKRLPRYGWPVTWVLAMTEGKDAHGYLGILLRPGDNVVTTTFGPVDGMPWVKPMDPNELLEIAKSVEPGITGLAIPEDGALRALCAAKHLTEGRHPIVLTGSLYLVGDFHREFRSRRSNDYWKEPQFKEDREMFSNMLEDEKIRVNQLLSGHQPDLFSQPPNKNIRKDEKKNEVREKQQSEREKRRNIQEEIEALDRELKRLGDEERRVAQGQPSNPSDNTPSPSNNASAIEAALPTPTKPNNEATSAQKTLASPPSPRYSPNSSPARKSHTPSTKQPPKKTATAISPEPTKEPTKEPTEPPTEAPQAQPVPWLFSSLEPNKKVVPLTKLIWHDKKTPVGYFKVTKGGKKKY
jgi:folylpolyglutamate synthase/dihydrofolate synthase